MPPRVDPARAVVVYAPPVDATIDGDAPPWTTQPTGAQLLALGGDIDWTLDLDDTDEDPGPPPPPVQAPPPIEPEPLPMTTIGPSPFNYVPTGQWMWYVPSMNTATTWLGTWGMTQVSLPNGTTTSYYEWIGTLPTHTAHTYEYTYAPTAPVSLDAWIDACDAERARRRFVPATPLAFEGHAKNGKAKWMRWQKEAYERLHKERPIVLYG